LAIAWKLLGHPWCADGQDTVASRLLILDLVSGIESCGYLIYACIDQSIGHDGSDTDSWYLRRAMNWSPSMPVHLNH